MVNITEKVNYYLDKGYSRLYANSKVAQDIILLGIAKSDVKNNVTIKGGVVIFNITNDKRRATEDIDIDFIKYSLSDESIKIFLNKIVNKELGVSINLTKEPLLLKHQNYKGKRIFIKLQDTYNNILKVKMDIGVQSDLNVTQEEHLFIFESLNNKLILKINTKEQIFVEKLVSLLSHGIGSTRYKDIYDFYYFITEAKLDNVKVLKLMDSYLLKNNTSIVKIHDIYDELNMIFDSRSFKNNLKSTKYNWVQVNPEIATKIILDYIKNLEGMLVYE